MRTCVWPAMTIDVYVYVAPSTILDILSLSLSVAAFAFYRQRLYGIFPASAAFDDKSVCVCVDSPCMHCGMKTAF